MLPDLDGRVAVVTGAGSGIGAALCRGFAAEGMHVVAADIDVDTATATADAIDGRAVAVDVSDPTSVDALAEDAFGAFGQVDVLCNNAGVFQGGRTWEPSLDDWHWTIGVNLYGIVHGIRSFVPRMIAQGTDGHIVNTASVAAIVSSPMATPYSVSKAAAFAITECLAYDLRSVDARIGASVLIPSAIDTGIARTARVRPERFGAPEPTESSAFVTGFLADFITTGLAPADVVPHVIDAIRTDTFLIPTRPSYANQLRNRHDRLTERELPGDVEID
jgi:NAD(P)-dependent dehydrogenase (short-subunit alcohol dehydrogenase family)